MTKLDHTTSTDWKKLAKNLRKTPFYHHMQCIFDPKRVKTAKTRFFPELLLSYFINRPKIQFKYAKLR